jgi:hypothetical protein
MNGVGYYRCNLIRISSAREHQKALASTRPQSDEKLTPRSATRPTTLVIPHHRNNIAL